MIAFIGEYRGAYGAEPICQLQPIDSSTRHSDPAQGSAKSHRDAMPRVEARRVHAERFGADGARRAGGQPGRQDTLLAHRRVGG